MTLQPATAETTAATPSGVVSYTEMQFGTAEDNALLDSFDRQHATGLADRLLGVLERLDESLGGYQITRLEHSLQSGTQARLAGADVDWVVAALLHDIGDELAPHNHAEYAASVLRPYVRAEVAWVIEQRGFFRSYYFAHHLGGDRNRRNEFGDHPWFDLCAAFCAEWDQKSFDPNGSTHDLASFEADVRSVLARTAWDAEVTAAGHAELVS